MRDFAPQIVYSAICSVFLGGGGFFKSSTAKAPARIMTQNTSKDAVPRKDVPFGGRKTKS